MALASGAFLGLLALAVRGAPRPGWPNARAHLALGRVDCAGRAQSPRRVRFPAAPRARSRATILGDAPRVAAAPPRQRLQPSPHGASALTLAPARVVEAPLRAAAVQGRAGGACPSFVGVGVSSGLGSATLPEPPPNKLSKALARPSSAFAAILVAPPATPPNRSRRALRHAGRLLARNASRASGFACSACRGLSAEALAKADGSA